MIYHVELTPAVQKQFKKLTTQLQDKVWKAIENIALDPRPRGYKKIVSN